VFILVFICSFIHRCLILRPWGDVFGVLFFSNPLSLNGLINRHAG